MKYYEIDITALEWNLYKDPKFVEEQLKLLQSKINEANKIRNKILENHSCYITNGIYCDVYFGKIFNESTNNFLKIKMSADNSFKMYIEIDNHWKYINEESLFKTFKVEQ